MTYAIQETTTETDNAPILTPLPPAKILRELCEAASIGDIHHLSEQFEQLAVKDAALRPFVKTMQPLLKTFQIERLHQELERLCDS